LFIIFIVVYYVEEREDPKGTSQSSLKYSEEPFNPPSTSIPIKRRNPNQLPPLEQTNRGYRPMGVDNGSISDDQHPLIKDRNPIRQARFDDVNAAASLPQYSRSDAKKYPLSINKRTYENTDNTDARFYTGHSPEHEQALPYVNYST